MESRMGIDGGITPLNGLNRRALRCKRPLISWGSIMDMRGDWLTIENGDVRAVISRRGAQMLALNIAGRDLLWKPDVSIWAQTCPVLFPVIGRTVENRIRVNGKTYPMPMHGFAAQSVFSVTAADDESCVLTLRDEAQTLRHYPSPFDFFTPY